MKTLHRLTITLLVALLAALTGCVQVAPIPAVAHAGDAIVLGLGGINRNWNGEKPSNLQLTITDAASQTFDLTAIALFQAYPDYRSSTNAMAFGGTDGIGLQPYDGAWFLSVSLTDPNGPLNLAPGTATIHIAADNYIAARDEFDQLFPQEGDLSQIPIEIIAGPPSPSNPSAQFGAYDNRGSHFLVRPEDTSNATLGGAYYAIQYLSDANFGPTRPMPFPVSHNPFVKIDYKVVDNGDGSGTYYIYIYNPAGFTATAPRQPRQGSLQDLGIHFEYFELGVGAWAQSNFVLDAAHSYFIDIDGNRVEGLLPEMMHADQL